MQVKPVIGAQVTLRWEHAKCYFYTDGPPGHEETQALGVQMGPGGGAFMVAIYSDDQAAWVELLERNGVREQADE